ncbi:hypothetical protein [Streptomyces sp. Amel2xC10]|uniref:hypothetical protein n=1 Tax=Streptomyces sp. Amel2xC10 TaxID=1305826 RepID=UPI000A083207|nr:hypothetical protein [Streptomyces sp. Amel2xC10]SMF67732.1 hypothetical protein SAMN02745830_05191 [Streptomyces sp. Amel2xC10]
MTDHVGSQPDRASALDIAAQWAQMPAEHLTAALKALEPQLKREHELRILQENNRARLEEQRLRTEHKKEKRRHRLNVLRVSFGLAVVLGALSGAVHLAVHDQPGLALLLVGPTVLALAKMFLLKRSDAGDLLQSVAALRTASSTLPPPDSGAGAPPGPGSGTAVP